MIASDMHFHFRFSLSVGTTGFETFESTLYFKMSPASNCLLLSLPFSLPLVQHILLSRINGNPAVLVLNSFWS